MGRIGGQVNEDGVNQQGKKREEELKEDNEIKTVTKNKERV